MRSVTMNLEVLDCHCDTCEEQFEHYKLSDFVYGELLLSSEDGKQLVYLNTFEDSVFDEVCDIVKDICRKDDEDKIRQAVNTALGYAYDLVEGQRVFKDLKRKCPKCGSTNLRCYYRKDWKTMTLRCAEHYEWDKLSVDEKKLLLAGVIGDGK